MNESQLETFLTVAQYKSYSKAADILNVTQPTITSRIKALEDILQCSLFIRVGHEIFLTKEGDLLTDYAKNILTYMKYCKEIPNILKDPLIKVGFSPGYTYSFVVELLKTIQSIGKVDIQIVEGYDSVQLVERCLAGEIDLVFTRELQNNHRDIISEYLFDNNLVAVIPKSHPLCNKEELQLNDLDGETIISYRRDSELWRLIDRYLISTENTMRIDVDNNEMLLQSVYNGIGIGIIPELGVDKRYLTNMEVRKIKEISNIPNKVYVKYRKSAQMKELARKIIYSIINHRYAEV